MRHAVQNGIENLSGTNVSMNAHPEDGYRFRARTAEELKQSEHLVPRVNPADLPPPEENNAIVVQPGQRLELPKIVLPPKGWLL